MVRAGDQQHHNDSMRPLCVVSGRCRPRWAAENCQTNRLRLRRRVGFFSWTFLFHLVGLKKCVGWFCFLPTRRKKFIEVCASSPASVFNCSHFHVHQNAQVGTLCEIYLYCCLHITKISTPSTWPMRKPLVTSQKDEYISVQLRSRRRRVTHSHLFSRFHWYVWRSTASKGM